MSTHTTTRPPSAPPPGDGGRDSMSVCSIAVWVLVALVGATCWAVLALSL